VAAHQEQSLAVARALGADNRQRLIEEFLDQHGQVTPDSAWQLVYRLLLWINRTIGLAHCYESDKCQPGGQWYARSLAFHAWLSDQLSIHPSDLGTSIDQLFRSAISELARRDPEERATKAAAQRIGYEALPEPGEDAELVEIVRKAMAPYLAEDPSAPSWKAFTSQVYSYFFLENKRKNLLGEGFEDTLAALIRRIPGAESVTVSNRVLLGDIPGFQQQGAAEKQKRVDLAVVSPAGNRTLVTAKWSVRADREEQFGTDFDAYVRANVGAPFSYVLVTNEFDAARIKAACRRVAGNAPLFESVVHINPLGVLTAYEGTKRGAALVLGQLMEEGRLTSLETWLQSLLG
jgi:hypothetical protein